MLNVNATGIPCFKGQKPTVKIIETELKNVTPTVEKILTGTAVAAGAATVQMNSALNDKLNSLNAVNLYSNNAGFVPAEDDPEGYWENFVNNGEELTEEQFLEGKYEGDTKAYELGEENIDISENDEQQDAYDTIPDTTLFGSVRTNTDNDFEDYYYHL